MKNLFTVLIGLFSISLFAQAPTSFNLTDDVSNSTDFSVGIIFNGDAAGNVLLDNSTFHFFIHKDYTGTNLTDIQGGSWNQSNFIPNANLIGACGAGVAADYTMVAVSTGGQANLGSITNGTVEEMLIVSLVGPGDPTLAVLPLDPAGGDALSACVAGFGIDNVADIDLDGNGGDASIGYEDIAGGSSIVLPIELHSFDVTKRDDESAILNWETTSEINSAYFGIERSPNNVNWETIGRVEAVGNSSSTETYSHIDEFRRIDADTYYYRLKMVDMDGQYDYSATRSISFDGELVKTRSFTMYPNPTKDFIKISVLNTDESSNVSLQVFDLAGKLVLTQSLNTAMENTISIQDLNTGAYNAIVRVGTEELLTKKFVIEK